MIEWLINKLARERHDIGRHGVPVYLIRWVLWGKRYGDGRKVFLHCFCRSDDDVPHDHPWPYTSVVLWGGYWEHTFTGRVNLQTGERELTRKWYGPGSIIRREAHHVHRVEIPEGKRCWTLFIPGAKVRSWFFHCNSGPVEWRTFIGRQEAGQRGCGDAS